MSGVCLFFLLYVAAILLFLMAVFSDRIVVFLMRWLNLPLFPTAVGIAISIMEHPEEWSSNKHELCHCDIGSIWIANDAYGIRVETAFGTWNPNRIERRIIREAVDWRIGGYIRNRIAHSIQRRTLQ